MGLYGIREHHERHEGNVSKIHGTTNIILLKKVDVWIKSLALEVLVFWLSVFPSIYDYG